MYHLNITDFDQFLTTYWQKRPCVIRNGFELFNDPIDEHLLAGMAMEEAVDSRIVSKQNNQWQVHQGPFDEYEPFCQGQWTLLVQGVDRLDEKTKALLAAFSMIPEWRIEDIMVSFSVAGAGVGAHVDQYDVFIVQGKGSRRWQVGPRGDYQTIAPHPDLRQIEEMQILLDEVLFPGDIIYIPPGFPHNGVAQQECLNYSIGLRAPSGADLLLGFADWVSEQQQFEQIRYTDPDLQTRSCPFEMKQQELQQFRTLMLQMVESQHFEEFLGSFLSRPYDEDGYLIENTQKISSQQVKSLIERKTLLSRNATAKLLLLPTSEARHNHKHRQSNWCLYVNQHQLTVPDKYVEIVKSLLSQQQFSIPRKFYYENSLFFIQLVSTLINTGSYDAEIFSD